MVVSGNLFEEAWDALEFYSFDARNGEVFKLEDICIDVNKCENFLYTYFIEVLKTDKRNADLVPNYESIVKENLFKPGSYGFTSSGFALVIKKGVIASDASKYFAYALPYEHLNEFLKEDFRI